MTRNSERLSLDVIKISTDGFCSYWLVSLAFSMDSVILLLFICILNEIVVFIGIITALIACFIDIVIDQLSIIKYSFLKRGKSAWYCLKCANFHDILFAEVDLNILTGDLYVPYLYYALVSAIPVMIGSFLVAYVEVSDFFFVNTAHTNGPYSIFAACKYNITVADEVCALHRLQWYYICMSGSLSYFIIHKHLTFCTVCENDLLTCLIWYNSSQWPEVVAYRWWNAT